MLLWGNEKYRIYIIFANPLLQHFDLLLTFLVKYLGKFSILFATPPLHQAMQILADQAVDCQCVFDCETVQQILIMYLV